MVLSAGFSKLKAWLMATPVRAVLKKLQRAPVLGRYLSSLATIPDGRILLGRGDMRRDWDERACANAFYAVDSNDSQSDELFWASGERDLKELVLRGIELTGQDTVVEIGCGVGRLAVPLAARAGVVHAFDISPEMVRLAQQRTKELRNVTVQVTDGSLPLPDNSVDFCLAHSVFIHFPDIVHVRGYLDEAYRVLKPGGLFRFDIRGARTDGDILLHAGTVKGVLVSERMLSERAAAAGFEVVECRWSPEDRSRTVKATDPEAQFLHALWRKPHRTPRQS